MTTDNKNAPAKKQAKKTDDQNPAQKPAATQDDAALLEASEGFEKKYAEQIATRVAAGLTREQAISVQREQVRRDLENAKAEKAED